VIAYAKLHLLRTLRRPIGIAALAACPLGAAWMMATVRVSMATLGPDFTGHYFVNADVAAAGTVFFVTWTVLWFTAIFAASVVHDERAENRLAILRLAGIDRLRFLAAVLLHAEAACIALTAVSLPIPVLLGRGTFLASGRSALLAAVVVLLGAHVAAAGVMLAHVLSRPLWGVALSGYTGFLAVVVPNIIAAGSVEAVSVLGVLLAVAAGSVGLLVVFRVLADAPRAFRWRRTR